MSNITNPLDILKRLDVKQNVTIRVIDEPTGTIVQEHVGHNAATNSLLTGIAHYLMGDGVFNQGSDILMTWVPQYISLGTMGLTSQESETLTVDGQTYIVPKGIGYTPVSPDGAIDKEPEINAVLRFSEYLNQTPGFGADGYDANSNNDREWFGLGYPYPIKPAKLDQFFGNAGSDTYTLSSEVLDKDKSNIISVTVYPYGLINQDIHDTSVVRQEISSDNYNLDETGKIVTITNGTAYSGRIAIVYTVDSADAANCELIKSTYDSNGDIVPQTLRSKITYRNLVPEIQSEVPNTLDVVFSAMISTGALKEFRGGRDYIFITEAGLWSKPYYNGSGDNGMLAGYRIMPSDDEIPAVQKTYTETGDGETKTFVLDNNPSNALDEVIAVKVNNVIVTNYTVDKTSKSITFEIAPDSGASIEVLYTIVDVTDSWKDMTIEANRQKVQQSIIRIGKNQVAQVIWKIQLGGLEQLNGLRYLYPSQYPEEVWEIIE